RRAVAGTSEPSLAPLKDKVGAPGNGTAQMRALAPKGQQTAGGGFAVGRDARLEVQKEESSLRNDDWVCTLSRHSVRRNRHRPAEADNFSDPHEVQRGPEYSDEKKTDSAPEATKNEYTTGDYISLGNRFGDRSINGNRAGRHRCGDRRRRGYARALGFSFQSASLLGLSRIHFDLPGPDQRLSLAAEEAANQRQHQVGRHHAREHCNKHIPPRSDPAEAK